MIARTLLFLTVVATHACRDDAPTHEAQQAEVVAAPASPDVDRTEDGYQSLDSARAREGAFPRSVDAQTLLDSADAQNAWSTVGVTMYGSTVTVAVSEYSSARMRNPDNFPKARIMVACDSVWVHFTAFPDLQKSAFRMGYVIDNSFRPSSIMAYHEDTYKRQREVHIFGGGRSLIRGLKAGAEFATAFPWHGGRTVPFAWSLKGSSAAILKSCRGGR